MSIFDGSGITFMLATVGFISMMLLSVFVVIIYESYTVPMSYNSHSEFKDNIQGTTVTRIDYYTGVRNPITGNSPIYVQKREVKSPGKLLYMVAKGFWISAKGIIWFIVESRRIVEYPERRAAWDDAYAFYCKKRDTGGKWKFYKSVTFLLLLFVVIWAIVASMHLSKVEKYSRDSIEISITEKENISIDKKSAKMYFCGSIKNNNKMAVDGVAITLYYRNADGDLLGTQELYFRPEDDNGYFASLEKNDEWEFVYECEMRVSDDGAGELYESSLDDIEISMNVTEISWVDEKSTEFMRKKVVVIKSIE